MVRGSSGARRGPRCYFLVVVSAAAVVITSSGAEAQHHSSANRINRDESANRNTHAQEYLPPSASIVVDGYLERCCRPPILMRCAIRPRSQKS